GKDDLLVIEYDNADGNPPNHKLVSDLAFLGRQTPFGYILKNASANDRSVGKRLVVGINLYPPLMASYIHPTLPGPPFTGPFTFIGRLLKVLQVIGVHEVFHNGGIVHDFLRLYAEDPYAGRAHKGERSPPIGVDGIFINYRR